MLPPRWCGCGSGRRGAEPKFGVSFPATCWGPSGSGHKAEPEGARSGGTGGAAGAGGGGAAPFVGTAESLVEVSRGGFRRAGTHRDAPPEASEPPSVLLAGLAAQKPDPQPLPRAPGASWVRGGAGQGGSPALGSALNIWAFLSGETKKKNKKNPSRLG